MTGAKMQRSMSFAGGPKLNTTGFDRWTLGKDGDIWPLVINMEVGRAFNNDDK